MSRLRPSDVVNGRIGNVNERPNFVCAFVGNAEPVRIRAIQALQTIGRVDVFGAAVGLPVPHKYEIARDYRFMLCFENDLYPGYVTEKALEAYECGCIPLWRGLDAANVLNAGAVINAANFQSLKDFANYVQAVDSSPKRKEAYSREPLFTTQPDLGAVMVSMKDLLKN